MRKIILFAGILFLVFFSMSCSGKTGKTGEENLVTDQSREATDSGEIADSGKLADTEAGKEEINRDNGNDQPGEQGDTGNEQGETTGQGITTTVPVSKKTGDRPPEPEDEGIITSLEGNVDITRNGESLGDAVEEDFGIQNFDIISTAQSSMAEIEVTSERCPDTILTVSENTVFSFEINKLDNTNTTSIDILGGGIAMKVGTIANDQDLEVNTGEVTMGVRGTTFAVTLLATGDTLITCESGEVECKDKTGKAFFAKPGKAIEKLSGEKIKEVSIALRDVNEYRDEWLKNKQKLLKGDILPQIKEYAKQYEKYIDQFNTAYDNLVKKQDEIINKWIEQDKKGEAGSPADLLRETGTIANYIAKVRGILKVFEYAYFRLEQLKKLHDKGQGAGEIRAGYTTTQFFKDFTKANIAEKLKKLKYVIKLFSKRNKGSVPIQKILESFKEDTSDDDSSDKTDPFKGN